MPRRARIALPNVAIHLIQRGNNRQPCFFADQDYRRYLDWLTEYAGKTGCRVHAYVLMTNHDHLLLSCDRADAGGASDGHGGQVLQCNIASSPGKPHCRDANTQRRRRS